MGLVALVVQNSNWVVDRVMVSLGEATREMVVVVPQPVLLVRPMVEMVVVELSFFGMMKV